MLIPITIIKGSQIIMGEVDLPTLLHLLDELAR